MSRPRGRAGFHADAVFERLSRRTSSGRYIPEIDGLRFICISLVVVFHVYVAMSLRSVGGTIAPPFGEATRPPDPGFPLRLLGLGRVGVQLFFAISGFVLALPFLAEKLEGGRRVPLRRYYLRRLSRLEPPYLVVMTVLFLLTPIVFGIAGETLAPHLGAGLVYAHGLVFGGFNVLNVVTWSLEIEAQFYLLVPVLAWLFTLPARRTRRISILIGCFLAITYQLWVPIEAHRLQALLVNHLQYFLVGWLLADIYLADWKGEPPLHRGWDLVSLVGWPAMFVGLATDGGRFAIAILPFLTLLLFAAAFRGPVTRSVLRNRVIVTIGGMCYSIYLLHYPLLLALTRVTGGLGGRFGWLGVAVEVCLLCAILLAVGGAFFLAVERPCMDPEWPGRLRAWAAGKAARATARTWGPSATALRSSRG